MSSFHAGWDSQNYPSLQFRKQGALELNESASELREAVSQAESVDVVREFDKLLEITSRCVSYYNKFTSESSTELHSIEEAFQNFSVRIARAFQEIKKQTDEQQEQLLQYLDSKKEQLREHRLGQEQLLRSKLEEIQGIHLAKLLEKYKQSSELNVAGQLAEYAATLSSYYSIMEGIQQEPFREAAEESVSFINHVVAQEIRNILCKPIPSQVANCSFSFNHQLDQWASRSSSLFFDQNWASLQDGRQQTQEMGAVKERQDHRKAKLEEYRRVLCG